MEKKGNDANISTMPLRVSVPDKAEVEVRDRTLSFVDGGIGSRTFNLQPGLYDVSVSLGGHSDRKLVVHRSGDTVVTFELEVPTPFVPADVGLDEFNKALRKPSLSRDVCFSSLSNAETSDSALLICIGLAERDELGGMESARIMRWRGVRDGENLADLVQPIEIGSHRWYAARFQVAPGTYLLECDTATGRRRQILPLIKGFQTNVFALPTGHNLNRDLTFCLNGVPLSSDSRLLKGQMRSNDKPVLSDCEVAQNALWHKHDVVPDDIVSQFLDDKFTDPILGLASAFLMIQSLERASASSRQQQQQQLTFTGEDVHVVFSNLLKLFQVESDYEADQGLPPDIVAFGLVAEPFAGRRLLSEKHYIIKAPPLYFRSWEILRQNSGTSGRVWITKKLWSELAKSMPVGPYFSWEPARVSLQDIVRREEAADELRQRVSELLESLESENFSARTYADFEATKEEQSAALVNMSERLNELIDKTLQESRRAEVTEARIEQYAEKYRIPRSIVEGLSPSVSQQTRSMLKSKF